MIEAIKRLLAKPTALQKAAIELDKLTHLHLEVTASIGWAQQRLAYVTQRSEFLREYIKEHTT